MTANFGDWRYARSKTKILTGGDNAITPAELHLRRTLHLRARFRASRRRRRIAVLLAIVVVVAGTAFGVARFALSSPNKGTPAWPAFGRSIARR
jgi:hypothetical protein